MRVATGGVVGTPSLWIEAAAKRSENQRLHCPTTSRLEAGATARPGESYSDVIIRLVAARPAYMKAVREFW
jgi:hypothetical protein